MVVVVEIVEIVVAVVVEMVVEVVAVVVVNMNSLTRTSNASNFAASTIAASSSLRILPEVTKKKQNMELYVFRLL